MHRSLAKWARLTVRRVTQQQTSRRTLFASVALAPESHLNHYPGARFLTAVDIAMPRKSKMAATAGTAKASSKPTKRRSASTTAVAQAVSHGLKPQSCGKKRCWPKEVSEEDVGTKKGEVTERMRVYHDERWGRPITEANALFGQVILQSMQSGLSWTTILNKEENFRSAFADFDIAKIAKFGAKDVDRLMNDAGIVRNRAKILAAISNAKVAAKLEQEHPGGFVAYMWQFAPRRDAERWSVDRTADGSHMRSDFKIKSKDRLRSDGVHPTAAVAEAAQTLKKDGFRWLGETTLLSFFQAAGMVNHHSADCFVFPEAEEEYARAIEAIETQTASGSSSTTTKAKRARKSSAKK